MKKGLFVLLVILMSGCSEYTEPQESDISVFEQFLSENPISTISPSIDIASIYQPGDSLFEGVLGIQRTQLDIAEKELTPLVEKRHPEAMFWLAKVIYRSGINDKYKALKLLKSAAQSYPYAAMALSSNDEQCQMYFPNECSDQWTEKAQELFAQQAKTGDVRAIYYNIILKPDLTHEQYINAIIKAADNHYFYPLVEYSNNIIKVNKPDKKLEVLAIKLLNYARFHNFVPAIDSLGSYEAKNNRFHSIEMKRLNEQGLKLGSNISWRGYRIDSLNDESLTETQKYIAAKATDLFNGDDFGISFTHPPKEKEALIAANKQAKAKADSVRKVIYIDGAHPRIF
jgi:hypothetical protein